MSVSGVFHLELWGGVECTVVRIGDRYVRERTALKGVLGGQRREAVSTVP